MTTSQKINTPAIDVDVQDYEAHHYKSLVHRRERKIRFPDGNQYYPGTNYPKPARKPLSDAEYKAVVEAEFEEKNAELLKSPLLRMGGITTGVSLVYVLMAALVMVVWDYFIGGHPDPNIDGALKIFETGLFVLFVACGLLTYLVDGGLAFIASVLLAWLAWSLL